MDSSTDWKSRWMDKPVCECVSVWVCSGSSTFQEVKSSFIDVCNIFISLSLCLSVCLSVCLEYFKLIIITSFSNYLFIHLIDSFIVK